MYVFIYVWMDAMHVSHVCVSTVLFVSNVCN